MIKREHILESFVKMDWWKICAKNFYTPESTFYKYQEANFRTEAEAGTVSVFAPGSRIPSVNLAPTVDYTVSGDSGVDTNATYHFGMVEVAIWDLPDTNPNAKGMRSNGPAYLAVGNPKFYFSRNGHLLRPNAERPVIKHYDTVRMTAKYVVVRYKEYNTVGNRSHRTVGPWGISANTVGVTYMNDVLLGEHYHGVILCFGDDPSSRDRVIEGGMTKHLAKHGLTRYSPWLNPFFDTPEDELVYLMAKVSGYGIVEGNRR